LLRKGTHHCKHLQASWNKYGEELFKFEVIEQYGSADQLEAAEDKWLLEHVGKPHCYNTGRSAKAPWRGTKGMGLAPMSGARLTEDAKQRLREAALEQWKHSDPRTGRAHSSEVREKISTRVQQAVADGRAGRFIPSEETRAKMSAALKGNQNAAGHERTEEHRQKLSEAAKGNQHWLGKTHSPESREKMGRAVVAIPPGSDPVRYATISELRAAVGLAPPTVNRALKSGLSLTRGPYTGWRFHYAGAEPVPLPASPEIPAEYADLPRTREEAKAQGAKEYFTGKPCSRGHVAPRITAGACTECRREDWGASNKKRAENGRTDEDRAAARRRYYERKGRA
jgi:hypothetical protein